MKKTLILLACLALPFSTHAMNLFENIELAKRCHQLALHIDNLAATEGVVFCKNKLRDASGYTEMAAESFASDSVFSAKSRLSHAIQALTYTAVEDCEQENQILLAKNEAKNIYDAAR